MRNLTRIRAYGRAAAFCLLACMAGCGGLRSSTTATVTYQLRAAPPPAAVSGSPASNRLLSASLQIMSPLAGPGLDTDAIVLAARDHRQDRYAASRWSAPLPKLLGSMAVDALRSRAALAAVHDDAAPFLSDYFLRISIRRFDADYANGSAGAPAATVVLDCAIGTRGERKLLSTFVAQARVQADDNRMSAVIDAFEKASHEALGTLADQTLAAISVDMTAH